MLKNKFKVIALVMFLILALTMPFVRAENETDDTKVVTPRTETEGETTEAPDANAENGVMPISMDDESSVPTEGESKTLANIKSSDDFLYGTDIVVDYPVDGNLFAFGDTVTINSQIGGDAFIFANKVIIGTEGYVYSSLFTCANEVEISGLIYDLYAFAQNVNLKGYVSRDVKVSASNFNVGGMIGRNAFVSAKNISFDTTNEDGKTPSNGVIYGNLNYSSTEEISIPESSVNGETHFTKLPTASNSKNIQSYILALGTFVCTVAIIWLLLLWLAPKFQNKAGELLAKKTLPVIGYGILTPIATIAIFVIFILLNLTSSIAFLALALLILALCVSSSIFVISANNLVCKKLKIEKNTTVFGMIIVSSVVLWLLTLIPTLGSIISFVASVLGLGIIIKSIISTKTKAKKAEVEEVEKVEEIK